jgi:hypothetical protein
LDRLEALRIRKSRERRQPESRSRQVHTARL